MKQDRFLELTESLESDLARLRAELAGARDVLAQRDRAIVAAHRAVEIARADNAALWGCLSALIARGLGARLSPEDADAVQRVLVDHPGAPMLAELDAARAVVEATRSVLAALPSAPDFHDRLVALSSAKHAYDQATKARET